MIFLSPDSLLTLSRSVRSDNSTERCITQESQPHVQRLIFLVHEESYTDKKERKILLIYKEIQEG
jgi:hypothetical protein